MSSAFSTRYQKPILPRVKDLECCREWIELTCDINNLKRMKAQRSDVKHEKIGEREYSLQHQHRTLPSNRQVTKRRATSEVTEPSLVYVHLTTNDNLQLNSHSDISEGDSSWQPPSEFERHYFTNNNNATYIDKVYTNEAMNNQLYRDSVENFDRVRIKVGNSNENKSNSKSGSVFALDPQTFHDEIHCSGPFKHQDDKADILFHPGSEEFRGSRERLHEIFEHNRLLRRQFFAETPTTTTTNSDAKHFPTKPRINMMDATTNLLNDKTECSQVQMMKSQNGVSKHMSGFGSTETLTSQSNHSGISSINGRKSCVDFDTSPEPIFNEHPHDPTSDSNIYKAPSNTPLSSVDIKSKMDGLISVSHQSINQPLNESVCFNYNHHLPCHTPPKGISNYSNNRLVSSSEHVETVNHSCDHRVDSVEKICFATRVKIIEDTSAIELPSLRKQRYIPPPLDLTNVNEMYNKIYEQERNMMRNYTVEIFTPVQKDEEDVCHSMKLTVVDNDSVSNKNLNDQDNFKCTLQSSKSLVELTNKFNPAPNINTKINDSIITRKKNKSCTDLSTMEDLLSPQLVKNLSNSMMDLTGYEPQPDECSSQWFDDASVDEDGGKSIGLSTPGTGTTLPFVYGPIPYKSPRRYVEGEVTIHYRSPVRTEAKEILSEEELAQRSAENMRRVYQEERRRKYLQELHDIDSRRHTDNFISSQKSPIPLNRYDDFVDDLSYRSRSQEQTPEPRLIARAMYNFVGQTSRELSFRRGDIIIIRRQIDKNWYEGEHNATVGLFPLNYVEVLPYDGARSTPKKSYEGQARAKFNFIAQTNLELSLAKGELVVLTRRVDENWYEGRIGNKKGIFPVTYVEVIVDPGQQRPETPVSNKPVASPAAHSMLSNGTASGKLSMGPHHYTPTIPVKTSVSEPQYISLPRIGVTERNKLHVAPVHETLHIDTHSDTTPYRALYNYRPQNEDELELKEGDMVYVMEKCDDGWFVGSSQRTGYFGTFPGNYVERL
ncbi:hypothetical protein PV325_005066 [Microctonus aethiopoides]|nr:hypothetical protein PV325_005066 [Microctonus aethiopoides]